MALCITNAYFYIGLVIILFGCGLIVGSVVTWGHESEWGDPPTYVILLVFGIIILLIGVGYTIGQTIRSKKVLAGRRIRESLPPVVYVQYNTGNNVNINSTQEPVANAVNSSGTDHTYQEKSEVIAAVVPTAPVIEGNVLDEIHAQQRTSIYEL